MRLSEAIPILRWQRRRLYAQSKLLPPEQAREYRKRAEAIGAALACIERERKRKTERRETDGNSRI